MATDSPDVRVYALSPNSIQFLDRIGAWKYIKDRSQPYTAMQIWEESGPGLLRFSADDMGAPALGRICEDQTIQTAIYQSIKDQGYNFSPYFGYSVDDVKLPANGNNPSSPAVVKIEPKDTVNFQPKELSARLVVGADGANSMVRKFSGISTWGWGYGQEAVVATVRLPGYDQPTPEANADSTASDSSAPNTGRRAAPRNNTAWQKYLTTGPLALLPLWDGYASIVWSTSIAECKRLKALPADQFLLELNAALQSRPATDKWSVFEKSDATNLPPFINNLFQARPFGPVSNLFGKSPQELLQAAKREVAAVADVLMASAQMSDPLQYPPKLEALCGPRVSFPLSFSQARQYTAPRCALVGDAAHSIHPQAGQGLNLGVQDAITLSDCIVRTMSVGGDIGQASLLKSYEKERYVKNLSMMTLVDGINTVFKDEHATRPVASSSSAASASSHTTNQDKKDTHEKDYVSFSAQATRPGDLPFVPKMKQFLRSAGMLGIHQLGPVKNKIAKFAMGLDNSTTNK
uniref:FAD-binding domain-containing protein n=1 Tax=Spumella elongata TaxID=89044 RepID=A0A7S3M4D1_9STRA